MSGSGSQHTVIYTDIRTGKANYVTDPASAGKTTCQKSESKKEAITGMGCSTYGSQTFGHSLAYKQTGMG